MAFTLSESQLQAHEDLIRFYINNKHGMALLSGSAGTGKTLLINYVLKDLRDIDENISICVAAPTHKALDVIREKCKSIYGFKTVHKLLHATREYTIKGELYFSFHAAESERYDLVVVDEASLINVEMYDALSEYARMHESFIIFIGDSYQLPPVNEEGNPIGPIFQLPMNAQLTTIMRAKKQSLMGAFKSFREYVVTGTLNAQHNWRTGVQSSVKYCATVGEFETLIKTFASESSVVLAYSNKQVAIYNNKIRNILFGNTGAKYVKNERLRFDKFHVENGARFNTSQEIIVDDVQIICKKHEAFDQSFTVYQLIFHCIGNPTSYEANIVHENSMAQYKSAAARYKQKMLLGINDNNSSELWAQYYSAKQAFKCPLIYGYSLTVHKSQGSTYENVFVDGKNIHQCTYRNPYLKRRCIYTAITRASKSLTFLM